MQCTTCNSKLPAKAKFCPKCGAAVPDYTDKKVVNVRQNVGTVKGKMVGTVLGDEALSSGLESSTNQNVKSVESGGTLIGTVIGEQAQLGGQRHYGDIIQGDNLNVGNISGGTGIGIGQGAQGKVKLGASADEIVSAFNQLLQMVNSLPEGNQKKIAKAALQGLEVEVEKGEQAEESNIHQWFSSLLQIAPDVWEVAVDTFINPIKGVSTVFKKVAEKAKKEKERK